MKFHRRTFLHLAGVATLAGVSRTAVGQSYPTRPVHLIVGFPAGTGPDVVARLLGQYSSKRFGQPFVIENRPGASSNIATEVVAHASPDGYTLLWITTANAINVTLYDKLNFNFIRDISPVATIDRQPFVMAVNPSVPAKTVPEFIAYAKTNPGKIIMGSAGNGSAPHVFGELFMMMAGVNMIHVPYRGNPLPDLLSGQVQVFFGPIQALLDYVRTERLRALAVTTATRSKALPNIPAIAEFVPGYEASGWQGVGVPKNTPPDIVARLNQDINVTLAEPDMKTRFADLGDTPFESSPAGFGKLIADDVEKWSKVIRAANIKAD